MMTYGLLDPVEQTSVILKQNAMIFIQEDTLKNVVCKNVQ